MSMYTSELFEFQIICVELWEWCSANCLASMQIGSCEGAQGAAAGLSSDNLGSHLLWSSWDPPFISVYNCFFAKLAFNLTVVLAGSFAPPIVPQIMRDPSFPNVLFFMSFSRPNSVPVDGLWEDVCVCLLETRVCPFPLYRSPHSGN